MEKQEDSTLLGVYLGPLVQEKNMSSVDQKNVLFKESLRIDRKMVISFVQVFAENKIVITFLENVFKLIDPSCGFSGTSHLWQ